MGILKKILSYLIVFCFFFHTISPCYASHFRTFKEVQENIEVLKKVKSVPAPLSFESELGKTGAGVLHYAKKDGETFILLGERDTGGLCNLGGISDTEVAEESSSKKETFLSSSSHKTEEGLKGDLSITASREEAEESNDILASHHRLLPHLPFIDVVTEKKKDQLLLYRMFWREVEFFNPDILVKAMEKAVEHHRKEYKTFKWYKVGDILKACSTSNPFLAEKEEIYAPLFATLCTDSGMGFLTQLTKFNKFSPFSPTFRNLKNRLYYVGEKTPSTKELEHIERKIHWPMDVKNFDEIVPSPKKLADNEFEAITEERTRKSELKNFLNVTAKHHLISLEKNASGKQTISLSQAKSQFAGAVSAHAAFLIEFKEKYFKKKSFNKRIHSPSQISLEKFDPMSPTLWDSSLGKPLTRFHLQLILGSDFKLASDYENNQRLADIANLKEYLKRFNTTEYTQKYAKKEEFKRKIDPQEHDYEVLADVPHAESQKTWPTFYHTANANQNNLWESFTFTRRFVMVDPLKGLISPRGTDIFFRHHHDMNEVLKDIGYDDYDRERGSQVMCFNFVFTAGRNTSQTSSNSIEYLLNNHSVEAQDMELRYRESMALAGFNNPNYAPFYSLFQTHLAHLGGELENSVLLACSINPDVLAKYSYSSHGGGRPYEVEVKELSLESSDSSSLEKVENTPKQTTNSALYILHKLQQEAKRISELSEPESFEVDNERKRGLIPELRLHIHPDLVFNPDNIFFQSFSRFEDVNKRKAFNIAMRKTTTVVVADWLQQENSVMPGSFIQYPVVKTLYKMIHEGITGETVKEKVSFQGFEFLIKHGHLSGVKSFVSLYPHLLEGFNTLKDQQTAVTSALLSGNVELVKYLVEDCFKTSISKLFPLEGNEFRLLVRRCLGNDKGGTECFSYLVSQLDPHSIPLHLKKIWLTSSFNDLKDAVEFFSVAQRFAPELKEEILKKFLDININQDVETLNNNLKKVLELDVFKPQEILEKIADRLRQKVSEERVYALNEQAQFLVERGADILGIDSKTEEPLIFSFLQDRSFNLFGKLSNLLQNLPIEHKEHFKTLKNKNGFTILQYLQKLYVEGKHPTTINSFGWNNIYEEGERELKEASYPPFAQFFGVDQYTLLPSTEGGVDPLLFTDNLKWVGGLSTPKTFEEWKEYLLRCPDSRIFKLMQTRLKENNPLSALSSAQLNVYSSKGKWKEKLYKAAKEENTEAIEHLLKSPPLDLSTYEILLPENKELQEKIFKVIQGNMVRKDEVSKKWKEDLKDSLLSKNFHDLSKHVSTYPFYIYFEGESLEDKLKPYSVDLDQHFSHLQKSENEWNANLLKTLETSSPFVEEFEKILRTAPSTGAQRSLFPFLQNSELAAYLAQYLEIVFPDKESFSKITSFSTKKNSSDWGTIKSYSVILHESPQAAKSLMLHSGIFIGDLLKTFSNGIIRGILSSMLSEEIEMLSTLAPDLLHYKDEERDFFKVALNALPEGSWKNEFCFKNIKRLKEIDPQTFIPYFFYLLSDDNYSLLEELYKEDSSLFHITSLDDLGLKDIMEEDFFSKKLRQWLKTKLN